MANFLPLDPKAGSLWNVWVDERGGLCRRPGLRRVYAAETGRRIVGGFSLFNPHTFEATHYVFDVATSGALDCKVRLLDEDWQAWQVFSTNADVEPRTITHAVVHDQVMIGSPDLPTLWGWLGSALTFAEKKASVNTRTTSLEIPRGIVTRWANRFVIWSGNLGYVSDPVAAGADYAARVFVPQNIIARGAHVFGAHETQEGMLVVVATDGVWGLPSSAAATGIVGRAGGQWFHITDHVAASYQSSALSRGRVYALTREGVRRVDIRGTDELPLDDPPFASPDIERVVADDWRSARIFGTDDGLAVLPPQPFNDRTLRIHERTGIRSWWQWWESGAAQDTATVGVLRRTDGEELLLMEDGAWRCTGNVDADSTSLASAVGASASVSHVVRFPPNLSPTLRHVHVAATGHFTGAIGEITVRGSTDESGAIVAQHPDAAIVGVDEWGGATKMREPLLQSARADFEVRGDEIDVVTRLFNRSQRIGDIVLEFDGPFQNRPTD